MLNLTALEKLQLTQCLDGTKDLYLDYQPLFRKLCNHYADEMPYGTMKFRTGDADQWILERVAREL